MTNNVKSEIKNTGFADIPCDETIHRDDNHIFHLCKWNIKDQFIGYSDVIFPHKDSSGWLTTSTRSIIKEKIKCIIF